MSRASRILRLAYRHSVTRFLALAGVGFAFDLTLLAVLDAVTPLPPAATVSIAFWVTYALNFALNRAFAFHASGHGVRGQLARFAPQVLGDYVLTVAGVTALGALGIGLVPARIIAGGTNLVFNYVLYRWWTFRHRPEPETGPAPVAEPALALAATARTDPRP
ncbi:Putative flippase GtrA (transmembrane translocase of bactoprenol-linked glucose) [Asanoa hainanensis]|uniref:Putative flippase GtrA (Transmembrane translocase of bactoprenol-linked glucose) n=1 Tax=Asanoa hainanensis TaxID=560556 RepID=A0A239P9C5_9ACTN|nr:GtrA family protein [Asanoa hainanensis]SNT63542.1 Putative flippase GtrA (transmembrane translocase of bactoprenol-linked glucose) [Asanoa hainanensis]